MAEWNRAIQIPYSFGQFLDPLIGNPVITVGQVDEPQTRLLGCRNIRSGTINADDRLNSNSDQFGKCVVFRNDAGNEPALDLNGFVKVSSVQCYRLVFRICKRT
jgi:hypothetical protein